MNRRDFIKNSIIAGAIMSGTDLRSFVNESEKWKSGDAIMPVLFIGHGAPMYTLTDNKYSRAWKKIASEIPKPKAILSISAHWLTRGTFVNASPNPKTIHDFGGMPNELFEIQYPAPGVPELANDIASKITEPKVTTETEWGFDHGSWTVVRHMYPEADIPMLQLSIDYYQPAQYHYDLAKQLAYLRKKGVLILASGNIVHNLRMIKWEEKAQFDWAIEFDELSKKLIEKGDHKSLINWKDLGQAAQLSIPTPDHYYPLIYALALQGNKDKIEFPVDGVSYGSTSMRSVLIKND